MASNVISHKTRYSIILVNNQLDAQFFFCIYIFSNSLHVSSTPVLIIRGINCINMTELNREARSTKH